MVRFPLTVSRADHAHHLSAGRRAPGGKRAHGGGGRFNSLGLPPADIEAGIRQARWPGRLELVASQSGYYPGRRTQSRRRTRLAAYIERFYTDRKVWLIYGAMRDKAVAEMAGILFPLADEVIVTAPKQNRAVRPESILELAEHSRIRAVPTLAEALGCVRATAAPADVVFITGSLFLVAEAR